MFDPSKPYICHLSCNIILNRSKSTCNRGDVEVVVLGGVRVAKMAKLLAGWTGGGT